MRIALANRYAYWAGHGEYLPDKYEELWYADPDEGELVVRRDEGGSMRDIVREQNVQPDWVTKEIIADGWDEEDPQGAHFVLMRCDQPELLRRAQTLRDELCTGPSHGDDDFYDYWPSGAILLTAMCADLDDREAAGKMRQDIIDNLKLRFDADEAAEVMDRARLLP